MITLGLGCVPVLHLPHATHRTAPTRNVSVVPITELRNMTFWRVCVSCLSLPPQARSLVSGGCQMLSRERVKG